MVIILVLYKYEFWFCSHKNIYNIICKVYTYLEIIWQKIVWFSAIHVCVIVCLIFGETEEICFCSLLQPCAQCVGRKYIRKKEMLLWYVKCFGTLLELKHSIYRIKLHKPIFDNNAKTYNDILIYQAEDLDFNLVPFIIWKSFKVIVISTGTQKRHLGVHYTSIRFQVVLKWQRIVVIHCISTGLHYDSCT